MNSNRTGEKMVQDFPQVPKEALYHTVRVFVDQLAAGKWSNLEKGCVDPETKAELMQMCSELIDIIAKHLYELYLNRLKEESEETKTNLSVSEEEVQQCLGNMGDIIAQAVAEVNGVDDLSYPGSKDMTELMVTAVTERVNSKLSGGKDSDSSDESHTPPGLLKKLSKHFKKILTRCATIVSYRSAKKRVPQSEKESGSAQEEKEEVTKKTPSSETPLKSRVGSVQSQDNRFMSAVKAAKDILQAHGSRVALSEHSSHISEEEMDQLVNRSSQDSEDLAFEIVECLTQEAEEEMAAAPEGERRSETAKRKKSNKKQLCCRIKAIFVRKFALGLILSRFNRLRGNQAGCGLSAEEKKTSSMLLIECVDQLLKELITKVEQETESGSKDLYEKIASNISSEKAESFAEKLSETLLNLTLEEDQETQSEALIRHEVDSLMKRMWSWLKQQVQQRKKKEDSVSLAMKEIKKVVVSELKAASTPREESQTLACPPPEFPAAGSQTTPEFPAAGSPTKLEPAESRSPTPEESDSPSSLIIEVWYGDSDKAGRGDDVEDDRISLDSEVLDRDSPQSEVSSGQEWDRLTCEVLVTELLSHILKEVPIGPAHKAYTDTVETLTDLIWEQMRGFSVDVDLSPKNMKKISRAVHKELREEYGNAGLWRRLLQQSCSANKAVVQALVMRLFPPKTSGVKTVFQRIFKPLTTLFKHE